MFFEADGLNCGGHATAPTHYKPAGFMTSLTALNTAPSAETARRLFDGLRRFRDWGVQDIEAYTWFMREVEWSWRDGATPLEDI